MTSLLQEHCVWSASHGLHQHRGAIVSALKNIAANGEAHIRVLLSELIPDIDAILVKLPRQMLEQGHRTKLIGRLSLRAVLCGRHQSKEKCDVQPHGTPSTTVIIALIVMPASTEMEAGWR